MFAHALDRSWLPSQQPPCGLPTAFDRRWASTVESRRCCPCQPFAHSTCYRGWPWPAAVSMDLLATPPVEGDVDPLPTEVDSTRSDR
jgi:hypothetical protein